MVIPFLKKPLLMLLMVGLLGLTGCKREQADTNEMLIKEKAFSLRDGEQIVPHVALAGRGRLWLSHYSQVGSGYRVWLHLLDEGGSPLLGEGGIQISDKPSDTWVMDYGLKSDRENRAILAFCDTRSGNFDVQAYRVSQRGALLWGVDGINLSNSTVDDFTPHVLVTNGNESVFAWTQEVAGVSQIVIQKLSPEGEAEWGTGKIITGSPGNGCYWPVLLEGDRSSLLLVWAEAAGPMVEEGRALYLQKFDEEGNTQWPHKIKINDDLAIVYYRSPLAVTDGAGGTYVAWQAVSASEKLTGMLQHVNAKGDLLFPRGRELAEAKGTDQVVVDIACSEDSAELAAVWADVSISGQAVYLQAFDERGRSRWGNAGLAIAETADCFYDPLAIRSLNNEFYVFWKDHPFSESRQCRLLGCHIPRSDVPLTSSVVLADSPCDKSRVDVSQRINGGFWLVWEDNRNDSSDIYGSFWRP